MSGRIRLLKGEDHGVWERRQCEISPLEGDSSSPAPFPRPPEGVKLFGLPGKGLPS